MEPMTLGSPVQSPVHLGQPPNFSNFQSPVPTGQPPLHSTMVGQGLNTPLGQSPALAGSQMQQSNPCKMGPNKIKALKGIGKIANSNIFIN